MIDALDLDLIEQQLALAGTMAWDRIYARATAAARASGFAQIILEHGPARFTLIDGCEPDALRIDRLAGAKLHIILDWG